MLVAKNRTMMLACVVILSVGLVASAAPVIKDFSSTGGCMQNKTGQTDRMYLVKPGDKITFVVKADGAEKYVWQVNKQVVEGADEQSFTFTVPNEKGIWEIHVKAVSDDKEAHQEWVISALPKAEAPDIFDYFSDGKYYGRSVTDPWGRKLPEWGETGPKDYIQKKPNDIYSAENGYLQKKPQAKGNLFLPSTAVYGTWRIKYKGSLGYYFVGREGNNNRIQPVPGIYCYAHAGTGFYSGHFWFKGHTSPDLFKGRFQKNITYTSYGYPRRQSFAWRRSIAEYGSFLGNVSGWVDAKIIHTPDGAFYVWVNGRIMPGTFNIDNLADASEYIWFGNETVDNVEVYKDRYVFPDKNAVFEDYQSVKVAKQEVIRKGIVINGRNVRLTDIAAMVGDESLFSYDKATKTAVCRTDLVLNGAAELVLQGETLKMHGETPGQRHIRVFEAATLNLENSTITSSNENYYQWRFTSPYNTEFVPVGGFGGGYFDARSILIARNSTIDNCGFLYLQSMRGLVLENTKFTNLVEIPSGPSVTYNPRFKPVTAAFRFKETMPTVPYRSFRNLLFTGKKGHETASVVFEGGDTLGKLNVYDSVFENIAVGTCNHTKPFGGLVRDDWRSNTGNRCWGIAETGRTLNLINCRFDRLEPTNEFCCLQPKYYLDLKVVDAQGRPVSGAKVTVTNEVDDKDHPAENLKEGWEWTCTYGEGYGGHLVPYPKWADVNDMRSTVTGPDGHTPPSSDKDKSLVLTDYSKINENNFDGIRIAWQTTTKKLILNLDVYDDLKGHILHEKIYLPADMWEVGQKHHAVLKYDQKDSSMRLVVTNKNTDKTVWDSKVLPLFTTDMSRIMKVDLDLGNVEVGIGRTMAPRGKQSFVKWDEGGYVSMLHSGVSSGGQLACHVDNLKVDVEGHGAIEDNDFTNQPDWKSISAKVYGYDQIMSQAMVSYAMGGSTLGKSFTLEFDNTLDSAIYKHYAASVIWLRSPTRQAHREFTYRITVEKDGMKKVITSVNPGPKWYRPEPNTPTYTITAVLDDKTESEVELVKKGLAGAAK